jgi:simple sugar transport system permease protein
LVAAVLVYLFFFITAGGAGFTSIDGTGGWMRTAAEVGIVATPVAVLMIAGEFDLSIGSVVGGSTMIVAVGVGTEGLSLELAVVLALLAGALVGLGNGLLVVKTGLPSFIVTLAANFIVLGLALGLSTALAGSNTVSFDPSGWLQDALAGTWGQFHVSVLWWVAVSLFAAWVLTRTRLGNWLFATGGNFEGARTMGVPTSLTRVLAFVGTGLGAAMVGVIQAVEFHNGNATNGQAFVFQAPIVAVIGGVLLTGGYGSIGGVVLGTALYGIISQGIFYTGWDTSWVQLFVGVLLLLAVLANNSFRKFALGGR